MNYLTALFSMACLLHGGRSRPSYTEGQGGYAPVGYHGPLATTVVLKSGHFADTPEVSAAKHLHYAALQRAKAEAAAHGYSGNDGSYGSRAGYGGVSSGYEGGYSSYGSSGYGSAYGYDANQAPVGYQGPLAKVVLLKSGHIADTPEVSAAKQLHYSALAKANAAAVVHGYGGDDGSYDSDGGYGGSYSSGGGYGTSYSSTGSGSGYSGSYSSGGGYSTTYNSAGLGLGYAGSYSSGDVYGTSYSSAGSGSGYAGSYKYSGPLAHPMVLSSGQLADTLEVSAARHAHLNAVAATATEHAQKWANNYYH